MGEPMLTWGLDEKAVCAVLSRVVDAEVLRCSVDARPSPGGATAADKQVCTFRCLVQDGIERETTLFLKHCAWDGHPEGVHYRHFANHGVPTPQFYGAIPSQQGHEVLFLEYLLRVRFFATAVEEWRSMLSLMAKMNACPITPEYETHLHQPEQIGSIDGGLWISGLSAYRGDDEIAADLQAAGAGSAELPALLEAAWKLFEDVAAQPTGLIHQDFMGDNLGWRGEELVVLDLQKMARGPRFVDLAPYLGEPDWSDHGAFLDEEAGGQRQSLIQHYLGEFARYGGPAVSLATCRAEMAALSRVHKISVLGWLVEEGRQKWADRVLAFLREPDGLPGELPDG
jgi:hypothetical protein